jgi:hypothetical protein
MDDVTRRIRDFMSAMCEVRDELDEIVRRLYQRAEVRLVKQFDPTPYPAGDFGVSADLKNGAVVDLWLELSLADDGWELHPTVQRHDPDEDGSHTERDFGVRSVGTAMALPAELARALRELRGSISEDWIFRQG